MGVEVVEDNSQRIWARRDRSIPRPIVQQHARNMRCAPTEAEKRLWWHLRESFKKAHFRRQVTIGGYIADFASHNAKLIIELDGGQHSEQSEKDTVRTRVLNTHGYRVIRFWNNDVLENIEGVLESIRLALTTSTPTPDPSPQGGGERARRVDGPKAGD